jgi:hypothetical protein
MDGSRVDEHGAGDGGRGEGVTDAGRMSARPPDGEDDERGASERPIAQPIDGWSNWVTFHDICRRCGGRITGFVCDSGRMTRIEDERWSVAMRWQHDGEGAVECDRPAAGDDVGNRSVATPE